MFECRRQDNMGVSSKSGIASTPLKGGTDGTAIGNTGAGLNTVLKDAAGTNLGTITNPIYTSGSLINSSVGYSSIVKAVIAANTGAYTSITPGANINISGFQLGGRAAGESTLSRYVAATTSQIPGGGFNSSGDVSQWTNTGIGDSAIGSWAYTTAQSTEGTGSASYVFVKSAAGDYPELTYTYSSPQDFSGWRYIIGKARVTVAAGGSVARTVQLRVTSGTAVRIWQIAGTTTTSPFSTEQWHTIQGELEAPASTAGSGTFDISSINSISLRLTDGANKTGTIYWDDIELSGQLTILNKLYTGSGSTVSTAFVPAASVSNTESLVVLTRNNTATAAEFQTAIIGALL
jgi:hypothetical protein